MEEKAQHNNYLSKLTGRNFGNKLHSGGHFNEQIMIQIIPLSWSLWERACVSRGSQWGGGFYGYRLKFWLFYGYRLIVFS